MGYGLPLSGAVDVARNRVGISSIEARAHRHHARETRERAHAEMRDNEVAADRAVLAPVEGVAGGAVAAEDRLAGRDVSMSAATCRREREQGDRDRSHRRMPV